MKLFDGIDDGLKNMLVSHLRKMRIQPRHLLTMQGDVAESIFFVSKGKANIFIR
jgi:hypothetical protein